METLFTPWRFSYISMSDASDGCFFCQAAHQPLDDRSLVVWRDSDHLVMLNRFPYTNGHLMVAPIAHQADPASSSPAAAALFWPLVLRCKQVLDSVYSPHGFNMGLNLGRSGGAGVPEHFHFHVVPRWRGDTNFMSVIGETRLVPEELSAVVRKLRPLFAVEEN